MDKSIPDDLFFDEHVVGLNMQAPHGWRRVDAPAVDEEDFYRAPGDKTRGDLRLLLWRMASKPYRFAAILFGLGFFTVFVNQAPLLYQIVLGAPIFEEMLKFGLAMLIAYPLRVLALRVPVALIVGAGFGVMEHFTTYSEENLASHIGRIAFHAGATGLSMVSWQLLQGTRYVGIRWFVTLPATFIHYVNNSFAILSIGLIAFGDDVAFSISTAFSLAMIISLYVWMIWMLMRPSGWRYWAWRQAFKVWGQPQGSLLAGPPQGDSGPVDGDS